MPVIRPVACLDKLEIIDIAKKIDTYETSILPFEDCCTIFVPDHPVINPKKDLCEEYEKLIPYDDMINKCIQEERIIKIDINDNITNDLLQNNNIIIEHTINGDSMDNKKYYKTSEFIYFDEKERIKDLVTNEYGYNFDSINRSQNKLDNLITKTRIINKEYFDNAIKK